MEPLPEVRDSLDRLSAQLDNGMDLADYLNSVAAVAQAMVPSCVGVSITVILDGDSFTITATDPDLPDMDAAQHLGGGPCLTAVAENHVVEVPDVLSEDRWQLFQQEAAVQGIRSSLSFPLRDDADRVVGGMNMYAGDPDAFVNTRRLLEVSFGADLSQAVTNADLTFMTRHFARELPERLDAREKLETAVGVLMGTHGWDAGEARSRLANAARLAGTPVERVADVVLSLTPPRDSGKD